MNEATTSTALQTTQAATPAASIVPVEGGNVELSASTPDEMVQCHGAMIEWANRKLELVRNEAKELRDAYDHAKKMKWRNDVLHRHAGLADKRVVFYEKFKSALEAGYCVVPNFPDRVVSLFAIRTDKEKPRPDWNYYRVVNHHNFEQEAKLLPQGEGKYQNPQPVVRQASTPHVSKDQHGIETRTWEGWADRWQDLEFPANMARLHVMKAATRAMALKIFDEIGFIPEDSKRNPDPILIGRITKPAANKFLRKTVTFLLAWHIDTRTL